MPLGRCWNIALTKPEDQINATSAGDRAADITFDELVAQGTPELWVLAPLDFHGDSVFPVRHTDVGALVVGELNFRLGNDAGRKFVLQAREQGIPTVVLNFGRFGTAMGTFIPVLAPVLGTARQDLIGEFLQSVDHQSSQVRSVGRSCVVKSLTDLLNVRMLVVGVPVDDPLAVSGPFQK